ncbi:MAG: hypothetical protein Q9201_003694, partial [Fulgogasparrea decipioides]
MRAPASNDEQGALTGIPGLVLHYPNSHVGTLKSRPWTELLNLLGKDGEQIMLDLILDCAIYMGVESGKGIFYQLSGIPLTELQPVATGKPSTLALGSDPEPARPVQPTTRAKPACKQPSAITFVRNRMFYARAALNAMGKVRFGLRHIHVLNRYPNPEIPDHTTHIMKHIFPRQFGLHNVFTSTVDPKETAQPFKDYTLREQEIAEKEKSPLKKNFFGSRHRLPRRLRGAVFDLVRKLQKLHSRCAYYELLKHYCPLRTRKHLATPSLTRKPSQKPATSAASARSVLTSAVTATQAASQHRSTASQAVVPPQAPQSAIEPLQPDCPLVDYATPVSEVSAFCRAVLSNLIPNAFWGQNVDGAHNKEVIMRKIDQFVGLRSGLDESLNCLVTTQQITSMVWLVPPHIQNHGHVSSSDLAKRKELLLEFLYYVFDSILIPLIRSNFHVTESNLHKNRIFYFRHDVWRELAEPALTKIKRSMFEEIPTIQARKLLDARTLGFSQIRLLPKGTGVRPIMNLRRRVTKLQNGKAVLGRSINSVMGPVHKMFDCERHQSPTLVGSSLFSVGDMYAKLKAFRDKHCFERHGMPPLYFAKADVQSCFDTIPQRDALKVLEKLASEDVYRIARHAQIKASDTGRSSSNIYAQAKPARKFVTSAHPPLDFRSFDEIVDESLAPEKKNTVFVDNVLRTAHKKQKLLNLLKDHVERNIVKIGKKFFRQKEGIPQGSILSSLLCNCFYAKLESEHLSFVSKAGAVLMRLIDDFLLITTCKKDAIRFLQIMHDGIEEYGVKVNPAKSLANFGLQINGLTIPMTTAGASFPYCGIMINTRTLEIAKDQDRRKANALADSLTVEQSNNPGQTFHRKAINAFKIQTHKMYLDTNFNSVSNAISNIYQNFLEAAMKYYRYVKSLPRDKQPHAALLI